MAGKKKKKKKSKSKPAQGSPQCSPDDDDAPYVATLNDIATYFAVKPTTVRRDWRPDGMPDKVEGVGWPLGAVKRWRVARLDAGGIPHDAEGRITDNASESNGGQNRSWDVEATRRRQVAEADLKETKALDAALELARKKGELYLAADVDAWWSECVVKTREEFSRIPRDIKPQLPRKHAKRIADEVERRINVALVRMSDWRPSQHREE